jgi:hypothetical protein
MIPFIYLTRNAEKRIRHIKLITMKNCDLDEDSRIKTVLVIFLGSSLIVQRILVKLVNNHRT